MTHPFFTIGHSARFVTLEEPIRGPARLKGGAGPSLGRNRPVPPLVCEASGFSIVTHPRVY